jgi:phage-related tail protein
MSYLTSQIRKVITENVKFDKISYDSGRMGSSLIVYEEQKYDCDTIKQLVDKFVERFNDHVVVTTKGDNPNNLYMFFVYNKKNEYQGSFKINHNNFGNCNRNIVVDYSTISKEEVLESLEVYKKKYC